MSHRYKLRLALVLALCVSVVALTGSTATAASGGGKASHVRYVPESPSQVPARAAGIASFLQKLFGHVVHKARPIVSKPLRRRIIRKFAWEWTKEEAVRWYCNRWYAYFGYDSSYWYWAANRYYQPHWAWRICAQWGYFG